jgi:L-2-hydroxyglutarate oxidase LhgO
MGDKADVLICGGGIIGLTIVESLLKEGYENIVILEKEKTLGEHASGRNSGVLHAGIYYSPNSLKARFCHKGNVMMKKYCRENNIPVLETGKVIVTKNEDEIELLRDLYQRALTNGVNAELIDEERLKTIEPYAKTKGLALYSPDTAVVSPKDILENIRKDLISSGNVKILEGTGFRGLKGSSEVMTGDGNIKFGLFINAAGAYSDRIAHEFGLGLNYKILPFKGTYKKLKTEKGYLVKGNIYPVPDIRNPFLGVHFTRTFDGTVYIGPTAIPALGRENYGIMDGIDRETFQVLIRDIILFFKNPEFRRVVFTEPEKYSLRGFFKEIKGMVKNLDISDIEPGNKTGIRPQLVDWESKRLVMDFIVLKSGNSIHILNTVSPGFTSSMAFADFVVENYVV